MRRVLIALGIVAILVSSCGGNDPQRAFTATLQERVASIRELAEAGKPGLARDRLENLVASVTSELDQGLIDQGWALEILESAHTVDAQLSLLPRLSPSEAPSPSPVEESNGDSKGNGKDKGHGDEGHGNDD